MPPNVQNSYRLLVSDSNYAPIFITKFPPVVLHFWGQKKTASNSTEQCSCICSVSLQPFFCTLLLYHHLTIQWPYSFSSLFWGRYVGRRRVIYNGLKEGFNAAQLSTCILYIFSFLWRPDIQYFKVRQQLKQHIKSPIARTIGGVITWQFTVCNEKAKDAWILEQGRSAIKSEDGPAKKNPRRQIPIV